MKHLNISQRSRRGTLQADDAITYEARRMPSDDAVAYYSAYSPSGIVKTDSVVYVNYAGKEDFQTLR